MTARRVHVPPERIDGERGHLTAEGRHYLAEVLADTPDAAKPALLLQSNREVANLKAKFVATCEATPSFKPECFVSPEAERSRECRGVLKPFWRKTLR